MKQISSLDACENESYHSMSENLTSNGDVNKWNNLSKTSWYYGVKQQE